MRSKTPAVRIRSNNNSSNNRTTRRSPTRRRSNISNDNNNSNSTDHRSNMIRSTTTTATSSATSSASASASAPTASPSSSSSSSSTPPINLSEEEVLFKGLECIHFGKRRQLKVQAKRNIERFRGNYGVSPSAISKLIRDLQTVLVEEHQIKNWIS